MGIELHCQEKPVQESCGFTPKIPIFYSMIEGLALRAMSEIHGYSDCQNSIPFRTRLGRQFIEIVEDTQ